MLAQLFIASLAAIAAVGCGVEKSRNPLTNTIAAPIPGVNIVAPKPLEPVNGTTVKANEQPLTLLFESSYSSGERPLWHIVELAVDAGFTNKVFTSGQIKPGPNGRSTVKLPVLTPNRTYFWRIKGEDGANTGPHSAVAAFEVVPPVVIEPPTPISPINNRTAGSTSVMFTMRNGTVSGPAGRVTYRVEIAANQTFTRMVASGQVGRSGTSSTRLTLKLGPERQLFWRARGSNGEVTSNWSSVQRFRTPAAPSTPSPGPGPDPGPPSQHCGPQPLSANRLPCVQAVAARSSEWTRCQNGNNVGCFRFVREVALELRKGDSRWGVLAKPSGHRCTMSSCGHISGLGYGEDIVAYCTNTATCKNSGGPTGRTDWQGFDIVIGAGLPGAKPAWMRLRQSDNRGNNYWSTPP